MNTRKRGRQGEEIALRYLIGKGYRLIKQNYYTRWGEIDLIVWDREQKELVFVEVKARTTDKFGKPEEAIDDYKLKKIVNTAYIYLNQVNYNKNYRFDALAIEMDYIKRKAKIYHLKNIG